LVGGGTVRVDVAEGKLQFDIDGQPVTDATTEDSES
jgi:hypothetical protein